MHSCRIALLLALSCCLATAADHPGEGYDKASQFGRDGVVAEVWRRFGSTDARIVLRNRNACEVAVTYTVASSLTTEMQYSAVLAPESILGTDGSLVAPIGNQVNPGVVVTRVDRLTIDEANGYVRLHQTRRMGVIATAYRKAAGGDRIYLVLENTTAARVQVDYDLLGVDPERPLRRQQRIAAHAKVGTRGDLTLPYQLPLDALAGARLPGVAIDLIQVTALP